jgi:acetolactate synthase small subunit
MMKKQTLFCLLQSRLGGLDKVLGTLTHWGFLPDQFVSTKVATGSANPDNDMLQVMMTFDCDDDKQIQKLIKYLNKQIYVLDIKHVEMGSVAKVERDSIAASVAHVANVVSPTLLTPVFNSAQQAAPSERRALNAHNG